MKFDNVTKRFDKGHPTPTMRIENVMATTQTIHYHCGNCCYKEQVPYGQDGEEKRPETPEQERVQKQATLF